jgi:hypothetical protein
MDAFVEEIAFFYRVAARADLQELMRLTPIVWVASTQGRSLADMARLDPQYLQSCQTIEGEGDRDTTQEKKRPRVEEGFRGRGLTAERRWDLLSPPTQLENRERTKNNLSSEDLQWAAIQIRKESQLLQFERVVTEETIVWRWTVEDLGWRITQSLPPSTGSTSANTHIHMTNCAPR